LSWFLYFEGRGGVGALIFVRTDPSLFRTQKIWQGPKCSNIKYSRIARVEVKSLIDVPDEFVLAEAEGDLTAEDFRNSHSAFRAEYGIEVQDATKVVLLYFELL